MESDEEFGVDDPAHASSSSQETLHDDGDLDATMTQAELQEIKTEDQELERESQEGGVAERHGEEKFCSSEPDPTSPDDLPGEVSEGADADRGVSYSGGLKYEVKSLAREGPPADDSEPRKETTDRPDLIRRRAYASREGSYSSSQSSDSALSSEDFPSPTPVEDLQGTLSGFWFMLFETTRVQQLIFLLLNGANTSFNPGQTLHKCLAFTPTLKAPLHMRFLMRFLMRFRVQNAPDPTLHECLFREASRGLERKLSRIIWRHPSFEFLLTWRYFVAALCD